MICFDFDCWFDWVFLVWFFSILGWDIRFATGLFSAFICVCCFVTLGVMFYYVCFLYYYFDLLLVVFRVFVAFDFDWLRFGFWVFGLAWFLYGVICRCWVCLAVFFCCALVCVNFVLFLCFLLFLFDLLCLFCLVVYGSFFVALLVI